GLSNSPGRASDATIAVGAGAEFVAWVDDRGGVAQIYVARHTAAGWDELAGGAHGGGVSNSPLGAHNPSITLGLDGQPLVAWSELGAGGATGGGLSNAAADVPELALTTDGTHVAVAWSQPVLGAHVIYLREFDGTTWNELAGSGSGFGLVNKGGDNRAPSVAY